MDRDSATKGATHARGRARTIALGAAGVVVLAAVIFGVSALSGPRDPTGPTPPDTALPAQDGADLFAEAMDALASGEATRAAALLERALVVDPGNDRAREELARIARRSPGDGATREPGAPAEPQPPAETPAATDPDAGFMDAVADLEALLPARVDGYELALPVSLGSSASVAADPVAGGPIDSVTRVLFAVHDRETPAAAGAFLRDVTRVAYPSDSADVTVDGAPGYFGTDGTRFAGLAYTRGRFVFEVILTASGGSPAALRDVTAAAARAFPDTVR